MFFDWTKISNAPKQFASSLMNIIILGFHSGPNSNCSESRFPMTQLYMVFQPNMDFSLDLLTGHHKCEVTTFFPSDKYFECLQTFLLCHLCTFTLSIRASLAWMMGWTIAILYFKKVGIVYCPYAQCFILSWRPPHTMWWALQWKCAYIGGYFEKHGGLSWVFSVWRYQNFNWQVFWQNLYTM